MEVTDQLSDQVLAAQSFFDKWLGKHNGAEEFPYRLNDAQKESLMWIGVSAVFAACFWKGIPTNYHRVEIYVTDKHGDFVLTNAIGEDGNVIHKANGEPLQIRKTTKQWMFEWTGRFGILQPIKYLTVLYHELCHAIVGTLSGGTVTLIIVDWNEGGATFFAPKPERQPSHTLTLPAGYIGSCIIGCAYIFAGFDAVASKVAALVFAFITLGSTIICAAILPKELFQHHKYATRLWCAKRFGKDDSVKRYEKLRKEREEQQRSIWSQKVKGKHSTDVSDKEKVASIQLICLTTFFIGSLIAVSWALYDSLYLRFVILFLGTINALYAIWDIHLDGIKYGKIVSSDCTRMARRFNQKYGTTHTVGYYARRWLSAEVVIFIGTVFLALFVWRDTMAEQALRSRNSFLATSDHYTPGSLLAAAKEGGNKLLEDVGSE